MKIYCKMDIDSDFGPTRGSEVFEHLNELYGKDHCCNIITFSNLQARAIIKDVCRSFEVPLAEVNAITKFVPNDIHNFSELLEIKELKDFFDKYSNIYRHCEKLYGSPRHHSQHPAGICVLPFPVTDIMPVENATPTIHEMVGLMSQFEKENTEMVGGGYLIYAPSKCGNCWKPLKSTKLQHILKQNSVIRLKISRMSIYERNGNHINAMKWAISR